MSEDSDVVVENQKVVLLSNCQSGIGIKIVGGTTSTSGRSNYGIFVKKIIAGSPAEREGCLQEGDKILNVNKEDVHGVSNARAMSVLVNAAKAGVVTFVIERSDRSEREYADLLGTLNNGALPNKYGSSSPQGLQHPARASVGSPTAFQKRSWVLADGRMSPMSPGLLSPSNFGTSVVKPVINPEKEASLGGRTSNYGGNNCLTNGDRPVSLAESNGDSGLQSSSSTLNNMSHLTVAHISLRNGLGMSITGGSNHPDGPNVTVKELIDGGDVECDGQIKQGDQIVSINDGSFLNITHKEAKMKLTQLKLRTDKEFEITYIGQGQFSLERGEREIDKENHAINMSTIGTSSSVKESSTLGKPELIKTAVGSQSLKAQNFDENGNYSSKEIHHRSNFTADEHLSSTMQAPIQPSSIPFYLQQDLALSSELSSSRTSLLASQNFENANKPSRVKKSPKRRLSLAPSSKLRVEKLEVALSYLGIQLTPQQQEGIRDKLHVDASGLVSYGEFVNVAQEVLSVELQDRSQALNQGKLRFALHNVENSELVLNYPMPKTDDAALEDLKRQRDDALAESRRLGELLDKKESSKIAKAEQLESIRRTANEALEESMSLKNQVLFATQAKMVADKPDEEYEEVIRLLEDELHLVKSKGTPKQQEFQDLQKKVIVLGCQLRKIEVVKRTYEVATKRLLSFAEHVHDCLKTGVLSSSTLHNPNSPQDERDVVRNEHQNVQQVPGYLSHRHASQNLADEARDLVRGVRVLLEEEPLPFGWEEAYTSEGERYFINHVTQITSWLHPVTHTTKEKTKDV